MRKIYMKIKDQVDVYSPSSPYVQAKVTRHDDSCDCNLPHGSCNNPEYSSQDPTIYYDFEFIATSKVIDYWNYHKNLHEKLVMSITPKIRHYKIYYSETSNKSSTIHGLKSMKRYKICVTKAFYNPLKSRL